MAIFYLRSGDGSDASDGSTWALAKATLNGAYAAMAAGDTCYVSKDHAESSAAAHIVLTSPGTAAAPCFVICVDDTADPEPPTAVATTATIDTVGNFHINFTGGGHTYYYGVSFRTAVGGGSHSGADILLYAAAASTFSFEDCAFRILTSSTSADMVMSSGSAEQLVEFVNVTVEMTNTNQEIQLASLAFLWRGGTLIGNQQNCFRIKAAASGRFLVSGVDLSDTTNSLVIVEAANQPARVQFNTCKLGAGVVLTSTALTEGPGTVILELINCDSGDTNYRREVTAYEGDLTTETTIVRTGGASNGTTPISWKVITTATPEWHAPFKSPWVTGWIDETGSKTFTAQVLHDSLTNLQDDEIWMDVEFLGTDGFPQSVWASDKAADILATPADQSTVGAPWTTTGLTNPNAQDCSVVATVNEIGAFRARVCIGKPSYTAYLCPKIEVS